MANCVTNWIFLRKRFCCCLPVRLGAAILSFLTLIVGGLLMVILWFEVHSNYFSSSGERTSFILLGILETFLFVASLLGFIGTCARKQSFVVAYAVFLYVHFLINLGVAAYFLWQVTHTANTDIQKLCEEAIKNNQAEGQCTGLLNIAKGVWWGVSLLVLAIEAYCALVVTRYVNQLRGEKRDIRRSRMLQRQSKYDMLHARLASGTGESFLGADDHKYAELANVDAEHDEHDDPEQLLQRTPEGHREDVYDPYAAYDAQAQARAKAKARGRRSVAQREALEALEGGAGRVGSSQQDTEGSVVDQVDSHGGTQLDGETIEMDRMPSPIPPAIAPPTRPQGAAAVPQRSPPPSYYGTPF